MEKELIDSLYSPTEGRPDLEPMVFGVTREGRNVAAQAAAVRGI